MLPASPASPAFAHGAAGRDTPGTGSPRGTSAPGPPAFDDGNTPGWSTMSAAERSARQPRMQSFKTHDESSGYMSRTMRSRPGPGTTSGMDQTGPGIQDATAPMNDMCAHQPRS